VTAARIPAPGPSFIRERTLDLRRLPNQPVFRARAGMSAPSVTDDGWWLAYLWVADDDGVLDATHLAPAAGPPPGTPLAAIGPRLAGALSGLIAEEDGRQMIRLRMPPADDEERPWERPVLCMLAIRWDPVRAEVMPRAELARELLHAFVMAIEGIR
jgi:hypothetical protein